MSGSCSFVRDDWETLPDEPDEPDGVEMKGPVLDVRPAGDVDDVVYTQFRRDFDPTSGKTAYAKFRVRFDHPGAGKSVFGFFSKPPNDDPFDLDDPPNAAAFFLTEPVSADRGELFVVIRSSASVGPASKIPVMTTPWLVEEAVVEAYDFVVEVVGTSRVKFWFKKATGSVWNSLTMTSGIPDAPVRLSAGSKRTTRHSFPALGLALFELDEPE